MPWHDPSINYISGYAHKCFLNSLRLLSGPPLSGPKLSSQIDFPLCQSNVTETRPTHVTHIFLPFSIAYDSHSA